jgi:hypothetical protein
MGMRGCAVPHIFTHGDIRDIKHNRDSNDLPSVHDDRLAPGFAKVLSVLMSLLSVRSFSRSPVQTAITGCYRVLRSC